MKKRPKKRKPDNYKSRRELRKDIKRYLKRISDLEDIIVDLNRRILDKCIEFDKTLNSDLIPLEITILDIKKYDAIEQLTSYLQVKVWIEELERKVRLLDTSSIQEKLQDYERRNREMQLIVEKLALKFGKASVTDSETAFEQNIEIIANYIKDLGG